MDNLLLGELGIYYQVLLLQRYAETRMSYSASVQSSEAIRNRPDEFTAELTDSLLALNKVSELSAHLKNIHLSFTTNNFDPMIELPPHPILPHRESPLIDGAHPIPSLPSPLQAF